MEHKKAKFWFVTTLTLGRVPLIAVFLILTLFMEKPEGANDTLFPLAFGAMLLSALTDLFDGYFARKFQVVSRIGGSADPVIDKIFFIVTLPTLLYCAWLRGDEVQGNNPFHFKAL
ncbi:CDP-alcohol phosphatidyltransferase family protein, partial [bacterium]|nr:CDP-alcohol phosphatidyltransferase family protein [bacterium]